MCNILHNILFVSNKEIILCVINFPNYHNRLEGKIAFFIMHQISYELYVANVVKKCHPIQFQPATLVGICGKKTKGIKCRYPLIIHG